MLQTIYTMIVNNNQTDKKIHIFSYATGRTLI